MEQRAIDIRLERDPRYAAAKMRLTELQTELNALERQRGDVQDDISSLATGAREKINQEAMAMLSGSPAPANLNRELLAKTLDEITHQLAVLRSAVSMQKAIVADLRAEVGKAIATDMLPQHRACVAAVVKAVFQLNAAAEAEADLREMLYQNDVPYSSCIRPMRFPGFGLLRDPYSRASGFVLECFEYDFITLAEVPDKLKELARARKAKPVPAGALAVAGDADGLAA